RKWNACDTGSACEAVADDERIAASRARRIAVGDAAGCGALWWTTGAECDVGDVDDVWCVVVVRGAEEVDVECIGWRKSSVTQMVPLLSTETPTPTCVKSWSRMFARCSGLCMNAVWMSLTVGPS